jgi:hypothetical protein
MGSFRPAKCGSFSGQSKEVDGATEAGGIPRAGKGNTRDNKFRLGQATDATRATLGPDFISEVSLVEKRNLI